MPSKSLVLARREVMGGLAKGLEVIRAFTREQPALTLSQVAASAGLPPATVVTAQIDPLRSEGQAYAEKLKDAGVKVNLINVDGVTHEFFGMAKVVDKAKTAVDAANDDLSKAFGSKK